MSDIPLTEQVARALLPDDQHDVYADQDWPSNVSKAKEVIGLVLDALIADTAWMDAWARDQRQQERMSQTRLTITDWLESHKAEGAGDE